MERTEAGESFEVTNHGRPVALLVPFPGKQGERDPDRAGRDAERERLADLVAPMPLRSGFPPHMVRRQFGAG